MPAGGFFVGRALLVIGKPIGALLGRGQIGDDAAPRGFRGGFAELGPVEGREIREVAIGDGTGAHALGLVAGMLAQVMCFGGDPLADHLHAFGGGGVDDLGAEKLQLVQRVAEDGHDHMVLAEALALGLEIIGSNVERFHERQGRVLRSLHLALLPFDATRHEVRIDRREGVRDDHVDRQVQHVEHGAGGGLGIFPDGEALAVAMAHDAFGKLEVILEEGHAGVSDVEGQEAVCIGGIERQLAPRVERPEKADELAALRGKDMRVQLRQAREEDVHGLAQAAQAFLRLALRSTSKTRLAFLRYGRRVISSLRRSRACRSISTAGQAMAERRSVANSQRFYTTR